MDFPVSPCGSVPSTSCLWLRRNMTSTVAVINWNSGNLLRTCIESLLATTTNAEILVIDNASTDVSLESVAGFRDRVDLVRNSLNRGFAAAVNQAFQTTSTSYVLILNPDIRVLPGAVRLLEDFMNEHPRAGAVGGYTGEKYLPKKFPTIGALMSENLGLRTVAGFYDRQSGRPQDASAMACSRKNRRQLPASEAIPVDQPAAAALMIRRDALEDVGGFDEQFYPAWYEDVDFCRRVKTQGWEVFFLPAAEFLHAGGYSAESLGSEAFLRAYYTNQLRYARKHFGSIGGFAVRASIVGGMMGRMIARPQQAKAY